MIKSLNLKKEKNPNFSIREARIELYDAYINLVCLTDNAELDGGRVWCTRISSPKDTEGQNEGVPN